MMPDASAPDQPTRAHKVFTVDLDASTDSVAAPVWQTCVDCGEAHGR